MGKDWKTILDQEVELLRQTRDEIRVQVHLGAADARDTWASLEKKWSHLESELSQVAEIAKDSAGEVESAAQNLIEEIKEGYRRVRDAL